MAGYDLCVTRLRVQVAQLRCLQSNLSKSQLWNVYVALVLLFVAESSRGMVVASLYGYLLSVAGGNKSVADHYQPLAVAAFSIGRLVAAPLFGYMMDYLPLRWVALATIGISLVGHVLYIFCGNISGSESAAAGIIVARSIVGLGSGVLGMCRAIVSLTTTPAQRTPYFSALSTAKFVGYALMPVVATGVTADYSAGALHVDAFTVPVIVLVAFNVALIPFVLWGLTDPTRKPAVTESAPTLLDPPSGHSSTALEDARLGPADSRVSAPAPMQPRAVSVSRVDELLDDSEASLMHVRLLSSTTAAAAVELAADVRKHDSFWTDRVILAGVTLFVVMNAVAKGILTLMETVATPMYRDVIGDSDGDITQDTGEWFTVLGAIGLVVYAALALPRPRWAPSDLTLNVFSMLMCSLGGFLLAHPGTPSLSSGLFNAGAVLIWSLGAPISDVVIVSCFSRVIDGRPQGQWMAAITMAGSVGRIVFPLLVGALSTSGTLYLASGLSLALIPAVLAHIRLTQSNDVVRASEERLSAATTRVRSIPASPHV